MFFIVLDFSFFLVLVELVIGIFWRIVKTGNDDIDINNTFLFSWNRNHYWTTFLLAVLFAFATEVPHSTWAWTKWAYGVLCLVSTSESMINISSSIGMLVIQMRQWRYADDCGHNLGGIHNFLFFSIFSFFVKFCMVILMILTTTTRRRSINFFVIFFPIFVLVMLELCVADNPGRDRHMIRSIWTVYQSGSRAWPRSSSAIGQDTMKEILLKFWHRCHWAVWKMI